MLNEWIETIPVKLSNDSTIKVETFLDKEDKLNEPGKERIRDLVRNPLRCSLLCRSWQVGEGNLPDTKAQLYEQFVETIYQWKKEIPDFTISLKEKQELNKSLGQLARQAIDRETSRFILGHDFVNSKLLNSKGEQDERLFNLALKLGWLNNIGKDLKNPLKNVYAFYHPAFQEYFAAKAIEDWHFFLKHIPKNPSQGNYRIFEPQWKEPILLWLGLQELAKEQKEAFIEALVDFDDGCGKWLTQEGVDKGFYEYRAYWLAAAGIAEFGDCSRADEIVEQIIQWGFGYLDEKQEQRKFFYLIQEEAKEALQETERTKAIAAFVQLLESTKDEDTRWLAVESLGKIGTGNKTAIAAFVQLLESTKDEDTRWLAVESLGKIGTGKETAIAAFVQLLESTKDEDTRRKAVESLGEIGTGKETAITGLAVQLLKLREDEDTRRQAAESLGKIGTGKETAIAALVQLLKSTEDEYTRRQAAKGLGQIGKGQETVIAALVQLLESTKDKHTRWVAAESLGEIGTGKETAIAALVQLLKSTKDEDTRRQAAESLGKIGTGKETAIAASVQLLKSTKDEDTRRQAAESLKKILLSNNFVQVVAALKNFLNDSRRFNEKCYGIIWNCAQDMLYPAFYQAWHKDTLDTSVTQSLDLADLPRILTEEIAKDTNLRDKVQLICIDGSKFIDRHNPATKIYTEIVKGGCRKSEDGTPKIMPDLQAYWDLLEIDSDRRIVLIFYEDPTGRKPQGFSEVFLDALSAFDGAICVVTEQPIDDIPLQWFKRDRTVEDVITWLRD
ncbi:MAG: hypothetical protein F6K10_41740 [Moorea sp. SIO2B7]|nr:hypothetical protein [Moorena sp. SIO2B7]